MRAQTTMNAVHASNASMELALITAAGTVCGRDPKVKPSANLRNPVRAVNPLEDLAAIEK